MYGFPTNQFSIKTIKTIKPETNWNLGSCQIHLTPFAELTPRHSRWRARAAPLRRPCAAVGRWLLRCWGKGLLTARTRWSGSIKTETMRALVWSQNVGNMAFSQSHQKALGDFFRYTWPLLPGHFTINLLKTIVYMVIIQPFLPMIAPCRIFLHARRVWVCCAWLWGCLAI